MPSAYITLDELRALKDALPHGAIESIAQQLAIPPEQVRAFLAAASLPGADPRAAIHAERGHAGGTLCAPHDDILRAARNLLQQGEGVPTASTHEMPQGETLPEGTQGASSQEGQMQDNLPSQASESQPIASAGSSAGASESQPVASQPQASEQAQASESEATVPGGPLRAKESPARPQADEVAQPQVAEEETGFPARPAWLEGLEGRMRMLEEQLEALLRGPVPGGREVPPAAGEGVTDSSLRARMRAEERARRG